MRLITLCLSTTTILLAAAGCSNTNLPYIPTPGIPFVHKIDVQQGNVVTQEMVAQLRIGMNKKKVRFVMGTPIIQDTFHARRWDYLYTYNEGGGKTERRLVTAVFNDDGKLVNLEGDVKAALGRLEVDKHQDTSVQVPGDYKKGMLAKLKDSMPFTGDDEPKAKDKDEIAETEDDEDTSGTLAATDETETETEAEDGAVYVYDYDDEESDGADGEVEDSQDEDAELVADADAVTVPGGAPPRKKKGFFKRLVDSVGLGAEDEEDLEVVDEQEEVGYEEEDRRYRDPTDPELGY